MSTIWECRIGCSEDITLPSGADVPMRQAIEAAFLAVTGRPHEFVFSLWGAELSVIEQEILLEECAPPPEREDSVNPTPGGEISG